MALAAMSNSFKKDRALYLTQQHSGLLDVTEEVEAWTQELAKQENFVITSKPVEYLEVRDSREVAFCSHLCKDLRR